MTERDFFAYPRPVLVDADVAPGMVPFDWRETILSQYANSPRLMTLVTAIDAWLDQHHNIDEFYRLIWNLKTAQGYGLDVWGRIVGVNRVLTVPASNFFGFQESLPGIDTFDDAKYQLILGLGFNEATQFQPLGQGVFGLTRAYLEAHSGAPLFSGAGLTNNYYLSDQSFRTLIFAKAAANITNGSIQAINAILRTLFGDSGNCYVTETEPTPYFGFAEAAGAHPNYIRTFSYANLSIGSYFGFQEGGGQPFGQQSFLSGSVFTSPDPASIRASGAMYLGQVIPHMSMTYTFAFTPTPAQLAIVQNSGVLPKPTGVTSTVVIL